MNHLINQLMTVDKAFYRHYLEMLLTLNRIVHAAVESQDFSYTGALPRTAAHQPVHGAGKGRDTLYEGMETERAGENNACMAATAVRGDKTGTVERLLVVSVFRNAMPRKILLFTSILRGIDVCP